MLRVFGKIAAHFALRLVELPFNHTDILASAHHVVPVVLQPLFGLDCLGEDHETRCVLVEPVHDENLVARIFGFQIVAEDRVGCALFDFVVSHREEAVAFIDHNDVVVLIDELHAAVVEGYERTCYVDLDGVAGVELHVELAADSAVDLHLIVFQQFFGVGAFAVGHGRKEKVEQLRGLVDIEGEDGVGAQRALFGARLYRFCFDSWHVSEVVMGGLLGNVISCGRGGVWACCRPLRLWPCTLRE